MFTKVEKLMMSGLLPVVGLLIAYIFGELFAVRECKSQCILATGTPAEIDDTLVCLYPDFRIMHIPPRQMENN